MLYAEWLAGQRLYRDAALVLSPVAYSAHASPLAVVAARAIEAIRMLADGVALPAEAAAALAAEPAPADD